MTIQIPEDTIDDILDLFLKEFARKREKKGTLSFNSMCEIYGKLSEENFEVLKELHKKDEDKFCEELMDLAITAIYGIMSIRQNQEERNG